jgi:hypothetical protein
MGGEPTCPECGTTVLPDWDWCQRCGFDPDGLRPAAAADAPPPAAPAPAALASSPPVASAAPPLLDIDVVQKTFGKKHLMVTRDRLVYGNDAVDFAHVTGYSWVWRTVKAAGMTSDTDRQVVLESPQRELKLVFGELTFKKKAVKQEQEDAFEQMIGICDEILGPRLAADVLTQIRTGSPFEAGTLGISREGFAVSGIGRRREYAWTDFAGAHLQRGAVHVFVPSNDRPQKVAEVSTQATNAPLLPRLMPQCAAEFGP